jgi:hypothetical protein
MENEKASKTGEPNRPRQYHSPVDVPQPERAASLKIVVEEVNVSSNHRFSWR